MSVTSAHAATFVLLCFAPLWVLGVAALHIHEYVIGDAVGGAGVLLCACGLLYGGYWRIQMRKKFGLPGSTACCGSKSLTDYARWLLCWPCALAQEVCTASRYHVDGEVFFSKTVVDDDRHQERQPLLVVTNHHHHDVFSVTETVAASQGVPSNDDHVVVVHADDTMMAPPLQVVVVQQVEEDTSDDKCSVVLHRDMRDSSSPALLTAGPEDESLVVEDAANSMSSDGSWRVERVKKLINMLTLVSLLILLYTRGFIR